MKVLVIGSGAREHAIVWKLRRSRTISDIFVAPGNAGTASVATNLDVSAEKIDDLARIASDNHIDLTIVGPEGPLAAGVVDLFRSRGLAIVGPTAKAARIESSKVFSRELMERYGIPCAAGRVFGSYDEASRYIGGQRLPLVLKADGLAAGKGVIVTGSREEAYKALDDIMKKRAFGNAGDRITIDDFLTGKEVSLIAFADGKRAAPMVPACDYKRAGDNDAGPNTGGMGSYSPPSFFGKDLIDKATRRVLQPAVEALAAEGTPFHGILYAGLMVEGSDIKALEFNARFGDPETQVILPRLESDLVDMFRAVIEGGLDKLTIEWSPQACVGVVLASGGYPGGYKTGLVIKGLDSLDRDVMVFHAGTRSGPGGEVLTNGGRVLTVVALGKNVCEAREKAYSNVGRIRFEGSQFRHDIALRECVTPGLSGS